MHNYAYELVYIHSWCAALMAGAMRDRLMDANSVMIFVHASPQVWVDIFVQTGLIKKTMTVKT